MLLLSSYLFKRFNYNKIVNRLSNQDSSFLSKEVLEKKIDYWSKAHVSLNLAKHKIDSLRSLQSVKDSLKKAFPFAESGDSLTRNFKLKKIEKPGISKVFGANGAFYHTLEEFATHNLKIFLIVLLPVFALFLKLLYVRRRIHYQNHLITMLHLQSFLILFLSLVLFIPVYSPSSWSRVIKVSELVILIYVFFEPSHRLPLKLLQDVYQNGVIYLPCLFDPYNINKRLCHH